MEFNRIITLLRKERGITQKQAAQDLGISQAQLSHYEKGIRECGLEFVVQVADYYGVSCDYLLGRSAERSGQTISVEDLPDTASAADSVYRGSVLPVMYKKLIENSLDILFDKLAACKDKAMVTAVSNYLMLSVYRMFRHLYQASPKNVASMFRVSRARWEGYTDAAMHAAEGDLLALLSGEDGAQAARAASQPDHRLPASRHQPAQPHQKQRGSCPQPAALTDGRNKTDPARQPAFSGGCRAVFCYSWLMARRQAAQMCWPRNSTVSVVTSPQKSQLPAGRYLRRMMALPSVKISRGVSVPMPKLLRSSLGRTMRPRLSVLRIMPVDFMIAAFLSL